MTTPIFKADPTETRPQIQVRFIRERDEGYAYNMLLALIARLHIEVRANGNEYNSNIRMTQVDEATLTQQPRSLAIPFATKVGGDARRFAHGFFHAQQQNLCRRTGVQSRTPISLRFSLALPPVTATGRWRERRGSTQTAGRSRRLSSAGKRSNGRSHPHLARIKRSFCGCLLGFLSAQADHSTVAVATSSRIGGGG